MQCFVLLVLQQCNEIVRQVARQIAKCKSAYKASYLFENELFVCPQGTPTAQSFATSPVIAAGTAVGHLQRAQVQPASKRASVKHSALTEILMHALTHALSLGFNYFSPAPLARDSEHLRYNESRVVFKDFARFHSSSEFI